MNDLCLCSVLEVASPAHVPSSAPSHGCIIVSSPKFDKGEAGMLGDGWRFVFCFFLVFACQREFKERQRKKDSKRSQRTITSLDVSQLQTAVISGNMLKMHLHLKEAGIFMLNTN